MSEIPLVFFVSGMALFTGIHHLLFAVSNPQKRLHVYLGFIGLMVFAYDILSGMLYMSTSFEESLWVQRGQFSTISMISALAIFFVCKKHEGEINPYYKYMGWVWVVFSAMSWIDSGLFLSLENPAPKHFTFFGHPIQYLELEPGPLFNLLYVSFFWVLGYYMYFIIKKAKRDRKPLSPLMWAGFALCYASAANDILVGAGILHSVYLAEYAYLIVVVLTDYALTKEFQSMYRTSTQLNLVLEERVRERMMEVNQLAHELHDKNKELENINNHLISLTERDPLTNLYHNRAFHERLNQAMNMARRENVSLGVGMIDVDHFKQFNDKYGHLTGDEVLKIVAAILAQGVSDITPRSHFDLSMVQPHSELRNYDVVSRYGGDEFAIILYFCTPTSVDRVLKRLCDAVRSVRLPQEPLLRMTISVGFVVSPSISAETTSSQIIEKADQALYRAKSQGRDQYIIDNFF